MTVIVCSPVVLLNLIILGDSQWFVLHMDFLPASSQSTPTDSSVTARTANLLQSELKKDFMQAKVCSFRKIMQYSG